MRSVVVVLPASMWAAMPMFLILSSGTVRGIKILSYRTNHRLPGKNAVLPTVVRESFVGFRHAVNVIPFLDRAAAKIRGVIQFVGQLFGHALFRTRAGLRHDPANRQAGAAILR